MLLAKTKGNAMQMIVEKMLNDFERGVLSRRQLAATLTGLAAAAALPATPAMAAPSLKAITLNHVTVRVPDLQKTSKFYQQFFGMKLAQHSDTIHILSVGEGFFGIEQKPGAAALDHYDFGLEGWDAKAMRAKVAAHGLQITPGSRGDDESFKFNDPDGFVVQVNGPKYTGHVGADAKGRKG
jgi:catechol 2,3-dioxygenase-like lactoylglutathione lyase family enzyme